VSSAPSKQFKTWERGINNHHNSKASVITRERKGGRSNGGGRGEDISTNGRKCSEMPRTQETKHLTVLGLEEGKKCCKREECLYEKKKESSFRRKKVADTWEESQEEQTLIKSMAGRGHSGEKRV